MKQRGRPVLGAIAGFFFFLFVALDLLFFGVIPLKSPLLTVLPVLGIVLGIVWARLAPLGGKRADPVPLPAPAPAPAPAPE